MQQQCTLSIVWSQAFSFPASISRYYYRAKWLPGRFYLRFEFQFGHSSTGGPTLMPFSLQRIPFLAKIQNRTNKKSGMEILLSVRPKPGFGIGNRNHDQVSVSVSAPELFLPKPKLSSIFIPWYYFSKNALLFGLENTLVQSNHFISCQLPDLFVKKMPSYLPFWYLIPRKIRIRYGVPNLK